MKKLLTKVLTGVTATVLSLSVFSGCDLTLGKQDLSGYVAVDINPSIEFITDKDGKVTEVRAVNDDAKVLLVDMELENLDISVAIEKVTEEAEECGYITTANADVSITISGNTEKAEKKLKELAEKGVQKGSELAKIAHDAIHQALAEQVEALKAENPELYEDLTVAKLKVINSIMEYDRSATLEELVKKDMDELVAGLKGYIDQFAEFFDDELEVKFEEKVDELAENIYAQIDQLIDDVTLKANQALLRKLEILEERFEHQLEDARPDGRHHFHFDRDFDRDEEDEETLSVQMKADIQTVVADIEAEFDIQIDDATVEAIVTIEDLDDFIDDLEEQVETAYDELSDTVKAQIETLKGQIEKLKDTAKQFVKGLAQTVKAQLKVQKDMMKLPFGGGNK